MDHVDNTAAALEAAADRLESTAGDVRRSAKRMRETGDVTYAVEAASAVAQVVGQCRLDVFISRALRAQGVK